MTNDKKCKFCNGDMSIMGVCKRCGKEGYKKNITNKNVVIKKTCSICGKKLDCDIIYNQLNAELLKMYKNFNDKVKNKNIDNNQKIIFYEKIKELQCRIGSIEICKIRGNNEIND